MRENKGYLVITIREDEKIHIDHAGETLVIETKKEPGRNRLKLCFTASKSFAIVRVKKDEDERGS